MNDNKDTPVQDAGNQAGNETSNRKLFQRYRAIIENQRQLICCWWPDGALTFVNDAYCRFHGSTRAELLGSSILPLMPADRRDSFLEQIAALTPETPFQTGEFPFEGSDGAERWVEWTDRGIFDNQGRLIEVLAIGYEITDRLRAQKATQEAHERLQAVMSAIPDIMFIASRSGVILDYWTANDELRYVPSGMILNKQFSEFFPADSVAVIMEAIEMADRFGRSAAREYSIDFPAGQRWFEISVAKQGGVDYPAGEFVCIVRDITRRKEAMQRMLAAVERQRRTAVTLQKATAALISTLSLEEVLDTILQQLGQVIDYDGASVQEKWGRQFRVMAYAGPEWRQDVVGARFDIRPGMPDWILFKKNRPVSVADVTQAFPQKKSWGPIRSWLGVPMLVKGKLIGAITLDRETVRPFTDEEINLATAFAGQAVAAIENARLYEQVQRQAAELESRVKERTVALTTANEQLKALGRVKDEFVANVSHELRSPITSLKLHLHLLHSHPENRQRYEKTLWRETERLENLIEGLLMLSKSEKSRKKLNIKPVNLNQLVIQLVHDRETVAANRQLSLTARIEEACPHIMGDEELVGQVLSILVTNALNYGSEGGQVWVRTLAMEQENKQWGAFQVGDNGPGIPAGEQNHIFERFYRGSAGRDSGRSGTGLGLAIAREIVHRHQGHIAVESVGVPGQGTTFTVRLPAEPGETEIG